DAVAVTVLLEPGDPEQVFLVRPLDRNAELCSENAGLPAMVDMAMGQQDFLDGDAMMGGGGFLPVEVAAGVDERAEHGLGAPQQAAILLQRSDRDDRGPQRSILGRLAGHLRAL